MKLYYFCLIFLFKDREMVKVLQFDLAITLLIFFHLKFNRDFIEIDLWMNIDSINTYIYQFSTIYWLLNELLLLLDLYSFLICLNKLVILWELKHHFLEVWEFWMIIVKLNL